MPPFNDERTIRINVDTSGAERELGNMARRVSSQLESQLVRFGQLAAFGLAGYGAARLLTSPAGQQGMNLAHQAYTGVQGALGFSPSGQRIQPGGLVYSGWTSGLLGSPEGYTGRNLDPSIAGYYGMRDFAQRTGAGAIGFMTGTGLTAGVFGAGALLHGMGIAGPLNAGVTALGRTAGGAMFGGATNLAGQMVAAPLRMMGFGGAADAVTSGTRFLASGATQAGRFIGGFAGSVLPITLASMAASRVGEEIALNVATQRQISDAVDQIGFRYTFGNATNIAAGRGFGARDQAEIASFVRRTLIDEEFMRQTDFSEILQGLTTSEIDFNVRSAEQFREKFAKVVSSLKEIARTFETSLEGAVELLGDMQRSGFYSTADQVASLFRANALARYSGMRSEQMIQIGLSGAEMARGYGFEGRFGSSLQTSLAALVSMRPDFIDPAERSRFMEVVQELGGAEAVSGQISDFLMRQARTNEFIPIALYGLADPDRGTLNEQALARFMSGEMNFSQLIARGQSRIAQNQREYERFLHESDRYFAMLSGSESTQFFRGFLGRLQQDFGAQDIRTVLASMGMDNQMLRYITEQTLFGRPMTSESMMQTAEMQRLAMGEARLYRTPRGLYERYIGTPAERLFATIANPFVQGQDAWAQGLESFYNRHFLRAGTVRITEGDLSLEGLLAGEDMLRVGEHQARFLDTQAQLTGALGDMSALVRTFGRLEGGSETGTIRREVDALRRALEELFTRFNQGRMSIEEFTNQYDELVDGINSIAQAAGSGGEALRQASQTMVQAFNDLRADEAGMVAIAEMRGGTLGPVEMFRGAQRARSSQAVRLSMTMDRTLSARAQNVLEELTMRGGMITETDFAQATAGLTQAERAEVMARLSQRARDSGGTLSIEGGAYLDDLYAIHSSLGAGTSAMSDAALSQAILQTQGMSGAAGRRRFLDVALQGVDDPETRDVLRQFLGEYRDVNLLGRLMGQSALDLGRLHDIMQERGISGDARSRIETMAGEFLGAMGERGLVNIQDIRMGESDFEAVTRSIDELIRQFGDDLDAATPGNLIGIGARISGSEFRALMRDEGFLAAAKLALENFGDPFARDQARQMLAGNEKALALLDAIINRAEWQGRDRIDQDLSTVTALEVARTAEGRAGISSLMRNRFSAIAIGLRERSKGMSRDDAGVLQRGASRIDEFLRGGDFLGSIDLLYDEDVIRSLQAGGYDELAPMLQLGASYRESGDREQVLAQARRTGVFGDEILGRLSGITDKSEFQRMLDAAIGAALQSSTATPGENIVYEDQNPETIARMFSKQFESSQTMTQIRDTNRNIAATMNLLNATLSDLDRTLRTVNSRL